MVAPKIAEAFPEAGATRMMRGEGASCCGIALRLTCKAQGDGLRESRSGDFVRPEPGGAQGGGGDWPLPARSAPVTLYGIAH